MKIFIGFDNTASTVTDIRNAFVEMGHFCYTALKEIPSSPIDLNTADYILQKEIEKIPVFKPRRISYPIRLKRQTSIPKKFLEKCINDFDVFIFFWETFFNDFSDLEILKKHKKKIIFVFTGDDVRWQFAANQEFRMYKMNEVIYPGSEYYNIRYFKKNLLRIRTAEKYADFIFSRLDQAQLQLRPYYRWNMMINANDYKPYIEQRVIPLIIHAPSAFVVKGSAYVLNVINKLKSEGLQFEFRLIENLDHLKFKEILKSADILIDQLLFPGTGKISSEAMAFGKVVLSNMSYDSYPQKNHETCTVIDVNPQTLYEELKLIIKDYEKRKKLTIDSRNYAINILDVRKFCEKVTKLVNGESISFDYVPDFFSNHYIPETSKEYLDLYNDSIKSVSNCDWYKTYVQTGERAGLKF